MVCQIYTLVVQRLSLWFWGRGEGEGVDSVPVAEREVVDLFEA